MNKLLGIVIVALQCLVVFAQKAKVVLSIEPTRVEVGETITITITSNVEGNMELENLPSSFVQDYGISQGSQDKINYTTGEVETTFYYAYSGSITKAGKYTIGPVYVKSYNKVYTSNKVQITVDAKYTTGGSNHITQKQIQDPAFGVIECNKTEIFEGEPILLTAKVYSQFDPSHISGYQSYSVPGTVNKFSQGNLNNIKVGKEQVHKKSYFSFQYDKNVFFPSGVGKVHVEPFQLNLHQGYKSFPITSSGFNLTIKPLPSSPPSCFIGAVGTSFSVETSIDSLNIKQGNVCTYSVIFRGTGNLNNIQEPKPKLPKGMIIYGDPERVENFSIGAQGAEGEVRFNYHIQVLSDGSKAIPGIEIAYFDPKKEDYITIRGNEHKVLVKVDPTFKDITNEPDQQAKEANAKTASSENEEEEKAPVSPIWKILTFGLPGLAFAGLLFLLFRKKRTKQPDQAPATPTFDRSNQMDSALRSAEQHLHKDNEAFFTAIQQGISELFLLSAPGRELPLSQNEMEQLLRSAGKEADIEMLRSLLNAVMLKKYGMGDLSQSNDKLFGDFKELIQRVRPMMKA